MPKSEYFIEPDFKKNKRRPSKRYESEEEESELEPEVSPEPMEPVKSSTYEYIVKNKYLIAMIIVVLILLLVAAWYFMRTDDKKPRKEETPPAIQQPLKPILVNRPQIQQPQQTQQPQKQQSVTHEDLINTVDDDELNKYMHMNTENPVQEKKDDQPKPEQKEQKPESKPEPEHKEPANENDLMPDEFLDDDEYQLSD